MLCACRRTGLGLGYGSYLGAEFGGKAGGVWGSRSRTDILQPGQDYKPGPPGGGAHGAFTWGVLDRLLKEKDLAFEGLSATSAGAMNAAVFAYGLAVDGRETRVWAKGNAADPLRIKVLPVPEDVVARFQA